MRARTAEDATLLELLDPVAEAAGYEIVRLRLMAGKESRRLQIMAETPDGDMTAYMASLQLLQTREDRIYYPAHGPAVEKPRQLVRGMIGHRLHHLRIIGQPQDHVMPLRQLERRNRPLQPLVQPGHRPLHPAAKEPAHRWGKDTVQGRHRRQQQDQHKQPERDFNHRCHRPKLEAPT